MRNLNIEKYLLYIYNIISYYQYYFKNGAGKSTTFNILTSLIPKTSGSVKLNDIEVNKGIMDIY